MTHFGGALHRPGGELQGLLVPDGLDAQGLALQLLEQGDFLEGYLLNDLANEMLDRVGQFMKKYQAIGKSLDAAVKSYEEAGRKLSPSGQSILQTCAKLEKLGARQSDRNPLPQLDEAADIESGEPAAGL